MNNIKGKIICVDFDGTIVDSEFPKIGKEKENAFEVLKEFKENGCRLILWTCREDEGCNINKQYLTDAVIFCKENGLEFDAINEVIPHETVCSERETQRKPYCHWFIDDKNIGGFIPWKIVRKVIFEGEVIFDKQTKKEKLLSAFNKNPELFRIFKNDWKRTINDYLDEYGHIECIAENLAAELGIDLETGMFK